MKTIIALTFLCLFSSLKANACSVTLIDGLADTLNAQAPDASEKMFKAVRTTKASCPKNHSLLAYAATAFSNRIIAASPQANGMATEASYLCSKDPRCAVILIEGLVSRIHMARPEVTLGFARVFYSIVQNNPYQVVKDTASLEISWQFGNRTITDDLNEVLRQISEVETIIFE